MQDCCNAPKRLPGAGSGRMDDRDDTCAMCLRTSISPGIDADLPMSMSERSWFMASPCFLDTSLTTSAKPTACSSRQVIDSSC